MHYRTFLYNKLVRDKTIERCESAGSKVTWKKLDGAELLRQLGLKCMEEAEEISRAQTKEEIAEEIADMLEVINAYCKVYELDEREIKAVQQKKYEERGGFIDGVFIAEVEHIVGSPFEEYCSADPQKYPEVKK